MKHAITNSLNAANYYREKNQRLAIEIVANGPGVRMFRTDTSRSRICCGCCASPFRRSG